jgi:hypothetical protein
MHRQRDRGRTSAAAALTIAGLAVAWGVASYIITRPKRNSPLGPSDELTDDASGKVPISVYRKLDRQELKTRMSEIFPDTHLTTISVVQGVALALLIGNFLHLTQGSVDGMDAVWRRLPYALPSFGLILTISFEYYYFVAIYRWSPRFIDACVPYSLGVCEIGAIYYLDEPKVWWWWNVALAVVGTIAFLNTRVNCRRNMFANIELRAFVARYVNGDIAATIILGIYAAVVAGFYHRHSSGRLFSAWDSASIGYLGGMAFLSTRAHRFIRNLHRHLGLDEG